MFPGAPEPWIDLSTGINPVPYPVGAITPSAWSRLPEPAELSALEIAACGAYGAAPSVNVVSAPGTQAIIQWLPRVFPARRVGILGPTYGEHEESWRAAGADIVAAATLADFDGCDTGVIVNPNNPDGRIVTPDVLASLAGAFAARSGLLIVDEAFMDVICPSASLISSLPPAGAVVLRSLGKAYGLAGLRLGFAVAPHEIGAKLRAALGPWAVSGPAIEIGGRALADGAWLSAAVVRLAGDAARLDALLRAAGFVLIGGTPLFRLAEHPEAGRWFERLGRAGILVRPFVKRPGALRFGIPHGEACWERLETVLLSNSATG